MSVICHELCAESLSLKATRVLKRVEDTFLERANLPFSVVKVSWVVTLRLFFCLYGVWVVQPKPCVLVKELNGDHSILPTNILPAVFRSIVQKS